MTTIVSIDELNTATEMPRQVEAPQATPENMQTFDEAVSRFQTALGGDAALAGLVEAMAASKGIVTIATDVDAAMVPGVQEGAAAMPATQEGAATMLAPQEGTVVTPGLQEGTVVKPGLQEGTEEAALLRKDMMIAPRSQDDLEDTPIRPEAQVVLQAAPMMTVPLESAAVQQQVSDTLKVTSVESAAALRSQMLVSAVEEVCEAIQVSPGVQPGQGEVRIQLKADVLSGTVVFLEAKGTTITVAFNPATADVAEILSRNITQFEQHLAGRVHNYQISARVKRLKG